MEIQVLGVRFVKTIPSKRIAPTRDCLSAWEETSITTAFTPAARISESNLCSSQGPGVV